jgi:hypothetical protein
LRRKKEKLLLQQEIEAAISAREVGKAALPHREQSIGISRLEIPFEPEIPNSSPVEADKDKADSVLEFFAWKFKQIRHDLVKQRWEKVKELVLSNDWRRREIKAMSVPGSAIY